jgi:hypothetical protein
VVKTEVVLANQILMLIMSRKLQIQDHLLLTKNQLEFLRLLAALHLSKEVIAKNQAAVIDRMKQIRKKSN